MKTYLLALFFCFFNYSLLAQLCFNKYDEKENCRTHFITEFGIGYRISLTDIKVRNYIDFSTNLGIMHDLNNRIGIGVHGFIGIYTGWHSQYGIRPRIAYYINDEHQINFSPGFLLYDSPYPDGFAGYSIETNLKWKDHFAITTRFDILADDPLNGNERILIVGLQTDGEKGAIFILVAAIVSGVGVILSRL